MNTDTTVSLSIALTDSTPRRVVIEAPGLACMSFAEPWWPALPGNVFHQVRAGATEVVVTSDELRAIVAMYENLNRPVAAKRVQETQLVARINPWRPYWKRRYGGR